MMARRIKTHVEPTLHPEIQNRFRKGSSCLDGVYTVNIVMVKRRKFNFGTHLCFIDQEIQYLGCEISCQEEHKQIPTSNRRHKQSLTKRKSTTRYQNQKVQRVGIISINIRQRSMGPQGKHQETITAAEIKFMRTTSGYTRRDYKRNKETSYRS